MRGFCSARRNRVTSFSTRFFGTGTTGAVAKRLGRNFIGLEREQDYIDAASARIDAVEELPAHDLKIVASKRAEPRVAFSSLLDAQLIKPGAILTDSKRRWQAAVQADGSLSYEGEQASIHKTGARVQGLDACNGWTFWHFDCEQSGQLQPIDSLRKIIREQMAKVGA